MHTMYYSLLFFICITISVKSWEYPTFDDFPNLDYPSFDDFPIQSSNSPPTTREPPKISTYRQTKAPVIRSTLPSRTTRLSIPPRINSVSSNARPSATVNSRIGDDFNTVQQRLARELYCLEVLGNLVASRWQEDVDKIPMNDLENIAPFLNVPEFARFYSNPESEWIQEEGMALDKLDRCVRNLVSKIAPRMDQDEIQCLNDLYPMYLTRENETAQSTIQYIRETSQGDLPFRSFYNFYDITQILFQNQNIDALDIEKRAIYEDMTELYVMTEEQKNEKFFIIEQECEWKDSRALREEINENARYKKFAQLVKDHVNTYLVAEILRYWVPGSIIPEYRYKVWNQARRKMDKEIQEEITKLRSERRDAQYLCIYAARLGVKFFTEQKPILFHRMANTTVSSQLATNKTYDYALKVHNKLAELDDYRLPRFKTFASEFKEGHYCLTNFARMVENHQRYTIATAFVNDSLPYGKTYCLISEMSAELLNPRYCKCQGTFCEEFGLATVRAARFELIRLPNNTYTVASNSSYRIIPDDPLIQSANKRIAGQKFNTWWYRHQKNPVILQFR